LSESTNGEQAKPKKPCWRQVLLGIDVPNLLPCGEIHAVQHSRRTEGEDLSGMDGRGRARPFVVAEIVAVRGGILEFPERPAGARFQAFDDFRVIETVEENEFPLGHWTAEALPDFALPAYRRSILGPGVRNIVARISALRSGPRKWDQSAPVVIKVDANGRAQGCDYSRGLVEVD
jgi:hypothetical protein